MKNSIATLSHKITCAFALLLCLLLQVNQKSFAQQLAFPGAEGFGKYATGGRTGTVYHVTNLNNSGAGSLRDAVSVANRIVVFDVAGVIKITDRIVVSANIYLAGQTAPGEGITVYGNGWSFSNAHNTICRYMKIRMGAVGTSGKDANGIADGHDMIFDHCSVSWGRDENFSINGNAINISIQNCMITQGLMTHSAGGLIQTDGGVTLYRNLYADNGTRNNKIKGVNQYVNNMVYNWSAGAYIMGGDSEGDTYANAVSNLFIQGPVDGVRPFSTGNLKYHIYENDNLQDGNRNGVLDPTVIPHSEFGDGPDFKATPYAYPAVPTIPANTLFATNLPVVGASLPCRDYADYFVINEVKSLGKKGALIANETVMPFGAPNVWSLWAGTPRTDTDNDGIPNAWETSHGLNPNLASDAMVITADGYTNIEHYINGIDASYTQEFLRAPLALRVDSATQSTISFSWFDYTEKELGYKFERKVNGVWVEIGQTSVNENYFTLTGLQPEEKDTFRVRAYNASLVSGYSNELIAKSKPIEVPVIDPNTFVPDLTWTGATNATWDMATNNWINNTPAPAAFTDSSKLLFRGNPSVGAAQTINIAAQMGAKDILVNSADDFTFNGPGFIAGSGSMNKTGAGKLALLNNNAYTGATVLRNGILEFNKLANGGLPSSIGASANYAFNWVWKGGKLNYTGGNTSTDRNATIDGTTDFSVSNAGSTVTMLGVLSGAGGLTKSGPGRLLLKSANPYEGETIIKGGVLEVTPINSNILDSNIINNAVAIGSSGILRLQGGTYRTSGGSQTDYENYPFEMYVQDSTENGLEPYRNANLNMNVHGNGKLTYAIPYLRELVQGDWSDFTGTLVANGVLSSEPSLLIIDNGVGFPSNRVVTAGNTKIVSYSNNRTLYLGGLSGPAGTQLSCGGTKTVSFGFGYTTYSVGAAGTDETFAGVINNQLYGATTNSDGETTIIKEGSGVWRLTGTNTYSGTTTVTEGALIVNGSNNGLGKTTVTGGILAGKGSLAGDVEVQTGGTLQPGDSSIGTLSLKAKLTLQEGSITNIQINKTSNTFDKISVTGAIIYNGMLQLDTAGVFAAGDIFKIFTTSGTINGDITQFSPATPGAGLLWKFKPATGELLVVTPASIALPDAPYGPTPTNGQQNVSATNSNLDLLWSGSSNTTTYSVYFGTTAGSLTKLADVPYAAAPTYQVTGLADLTTYYWRVDASNSFGTTTGTLWSFRTGVSPLIGDYRAVKTGYYDSLTVATGLMDVWETYNGTAWVPATAAPNLNANTVTIKSGVTVSLRGTTGVKNLVVESGATLKSFSSVRNLRVSGSILNSGTVGSSGTATERVNFEGFLANGTITLGGTGGYYLMNFTCNLLAQTLEVVIDANINMSGYMRGYYSNATSGTATAGQDDDNIAITINSGKTVTMGSSSYLGEASAVTSNTIVNFGNYTYNVNGTLDMRATGTSCITAHSTKPSAITININGIWYTGNAMRLASVAGNTVGTITANIGTNGIVDAGARNPSNGTSTNMVFLNGTNQIFYNITGNGVLKNRLATSEVLYPIGTNGSYCPAKITNKSGTDIIAVGVKSTFDFPIVSPNRVVNRQFNITPATPNNDTLTVALGWLPSYQAPGFDTTTAIVVGHFGNGTYDEKIATFSGLGTVTSPYYAKAAGYTVFSPFIVGNPNSFSLPLELVSFNAFFNGKQVDLKWNTAREINVQNFVVERSSTGADFISIGVVGANNALGYAFIDANPLSGISYYRLKIMDKDGNFKYSKVVTINTKLLNTITVYPNPAANSITVTHGLITKAATLAIYTLDGKLVKSLTMATGSTQTQVDIDELSKGYYLVSVNDGSKSTLVFSKQ